MHPPQSLAAGIIEVRVNDTENGVDYCERLRHVGQPWEGGVSMFACKGRRRLERICRCLRTISIIVIGLFERLTSCAWWNQPGDMLMQPGATWRHLAAGVNSDGDVRQLPPGKVSVDSVNNFDSWLVWLMISF